MTAGSEHLLAVSQARIAPWLEQAAAAGVDVAALLDSLGLAPALAEDGAASEISLADYYRLQNRLAILFGDETVHMSSRQLLPGSMDFVLQHVGDCGNLHEVMGVIARTYNMLHGGQFNNVVKRQNAVDYIIDDREFPYSGAQSTEHILFSGECILIFLHCMLMVVSPAAKDAVAGISVRRRAPSGDCAHLGYWNVPIRFGADVYRLTFDRDTSFLPITMPRPDALTSNAVYQKIVDMVDARAGRAGPISNANLVRDALSRGVVEQADVAAQMNVSVATLRRRLSEEGAGFRELRREVLNDTAQRMLLDGASVADVSDALGFSEFRAFSRAFKDWNGVTPKAFARKAHG